MAEAFKGLAPAFPFRPRVAAVGTALGSNIFCIVWPEGHQQPERVIARWILFASAPW
eukprot:CAMPEP_0177524128 /NCGR_PEP_ID=MMETSP0369-20130122/49789_1 /TAXON_ID=447022 ORGANISM="Scrippsiella hangoei-like, Strain SHHI-4" /NCGR_SAMPLE_ID=MMETSP0369 /ASSEMBLY_ACC=CAM_ASM_000364 /LENGTH=56 /DNA_ID=CAMNT_0019004073 /DNA_START=63 /DNA_END=230 /DNA_ORIENTATION=-